MMTVRMNERATQNRRKRAKRNRRKRAKRNQRRKLTLIAMGRREVS